MDHRLDTFCMKVLLCEIYRYNKRVSKLVNQLSYSCQNATLLEITCRAQLLSPSIIETGNSVPLNRK